jgi:hypothetical protein
VVFMEQHSRIGAGAKTFIVFYERSTFGAGSPAQFFGRSESVIPLIRWKESEAYVTLR